MRKDDLPKQKAIAKWEVHGDKAAGEVTADEWQDDKFNDGERVLVIDLDTVDGQLRCYTRRRQQEAIREALDVAEWDGELVGGWLELVYAGDIDTSAGTAKRWEASYVPPGGTAPARAEKVDEPSEPIGVGEFVRGEFEDAGSGFDVF